MTLDEYNVRMQAIYSELADISNRTKNMAMLGTAKSGHGPFDIIMARQDHLIQEAMRLTNSLLP